jgi:hypothetical protein
VKVNSLCQDLTRREETTSFLLIEGAASSKFRSPRKLGFEMKYCWEMVVDNLKKVGWSLGYVSAVDSQGRTIWIVDGHRDDESVSLCEQMKS